MLITLVRGGNPFAMSQVAQSLTSKPVKGMLTGPVTILNWSFPRQDISRRAQAFQIALALRAEVEDLEAAGCKIVQVCYADRWLYGGISLPLV